MLRTLHISDPRTKDIELTRILDVTDYRKAYRDKLAVDGLSFHLEPGQVLGMVGPNGAGKTTTLRAIAGIFRPTSGTLRVSGHDVVQHPRAAKHRLAYVPDDPHLFEALTVWEHLDFIASAYQVTAFEARGQALLERFDLMPHRDRPAQALSRGMRQKLALCCAWLHEPDLIMLDEPMTGLDPRGIRTLKSAVREELDRGAAFVISSHQLDLVEDLASHLLILIEGRRRFFGTMAEARALLATGQEEHADLEQIFFHATEAT